MSVCVYPCPCGYLNDPQKTCGGASAVVTKYQKWISGPILERIDIHVDVPRVDYEKLSGDRLEKLLRLFVFRQRGIFKPSVFQLQF